MDIQKLLDTISDASRNTRSGYHLTLGELTELVANMPPDAIVEFDDGSPLGEEKSYRGYYADLSFETGGEPSLAAAVLEACQRAASQAYDGYKGGDFSYGPDTPLWRAEYGCCGPAIIAALKLPGKLVLVTREINQ